MDVIDQFLENWKVKSYEYYNNIRAKYYEISNDPNPEPLDKYDVHDYYEFTWQKPTSTDPSDLRYYRKQLYLRRMCGKNWTLQGYIKGNEQNFNEYISNIIDKEAKRKRAAFDAKIAKKVGKVKNARLTIGIDGEINGFVEGDKGKISIWTIGAGGYNVQRYHYRVLIKEIKD